MISDGAKINFEELHFSYPHKEINNDLYDISSSMIRNRIQNQESAWKVLYKKVDDRFEENADFIKEATDDWTAEEWKKQCAQK